MLANLVLLNMFNNFTVWGELLLLSNAFFCFVVTAVEGQISFFTVLYKIWDEFVASPAAWLGFILLLTTCWLIEHIGKIRRMGVAKIVKRS